MVKVKEGTPKLFDGSIDVAQWIQHLGNKGYLKDLELIRQACDLGQLSGIEHATETGESCLQQGLAMADVLADLEVDTETLVAAIVFESVHYAELHLEDVAEQLGDGVVKLIQGVEKMSAISHFYSIKHGTYSKHQMDNIRKMLLAMADDVRVILIKLTERLCILRSSAPLPQALRQQIATEVMDIYAPLANRLGIGAIKWEMEDLSFRYLFPDEYKAIAKGLNEKRLNRERFVKEITVLLNQELQKRHIQHFAVYGRAKHIHSIYRKMTRKNIDLSQIYDAIAVRILVDTTEQCYEVLGLVHELWQQIPKEFDDYIMNIKPNGYQSLHTAVADEYGRVFEVQIRTFQMHEKAEMGVAAHWKYKEGRPTRKEAYERKIEWLREVLGWHRDLMLNQSDVQHIKHEFIDDRVYVFTPDGDVLDLPEGVSVLDFAYHVHSDLGHRCRGAKVNNRIVPLTYVLKTGDRVEILTGKEAKPSRDWLNPHLNYLKTSRAKSKVLQWFKSQHYDKNKIDGQMILEKELTALAIKPLRLHEVAQTLHYKSLDDLLAALGRGDVKVSQIINRLSDDSSVPLAPTTKMAPKHSFSGKDLRIEGVGNLLTHMARCCQPIPGDEVMGYITVGRGVSIHRRDCTTLLHYQDKQWQRFLEVTWGPEQKEHYVVDVLIKAFEREYLLRDITAVIAAEKMDVYALDAKKILQENMSCIHLKIKIDGLNSLSRLLVRLGQIPNVVEARRQI